MRDVSVPVRLLFRVPDDVTDEQVAEMVGTCLEWSTARDAFDTACGATFPGDDLDVDESPGYDGYLMAAHHDPEPPTSGGSL